MTITTDRQSKHGMHALFTRTSSVIALMSVCTLIAPDVAIAQQFVTNGGAAPTATGTNASAGGAGATAGGNQSVAVGPGANSVGSGDVAIGSGAFAQSTTTNQPNLGAIAIGSNTQVQNTAGGITAGIAIGQNANATNSSPDASSPVAIGFAATATGNGSQVAIGDRAIATGTDAIGIGGHANSTGVSATGNQSTAIGQTAAAAGQSSVAIGNNVAAYNSGSLALGANSTAGSSGSSTIINDIAIGNNASATGGASQAFGAGSKATTLGGVALGSGSMALRGALAGGDEAFSGTQVNSTQGAVSVGAAGAERQITNVAGGTQATDAVNVRQLSAVGTNLAKSLGGGAAFDPTTGAYTAPTYTVDGKNYSDAGSAIAAASQGSGAFVSDNTAGAAPASATGANSSAGGYGASATGAGSTVVGNGATDNGNAGTVAIGNAASAGATKSIAIGTNASTLGGTGVASIAIGNAAIAGGDGAVGLGLRTNASGTGAIAGGNQSTATGDSAVALGDLATAVGTSATAFGVGSQAKGESAFAAGSNAAATAADTVALGGGSAASQIGAIALGTGASSTATNATSIGTGATSSAANGLALGAGSSATRAGLNGAKEAFSQDVVNSTQGAVSVGANGAERQITNVAGGTQATDAVNVRQLSAVGSNLASSLGSGAAFDPTTGAYTDPSYTVGGKTYNDVGSALAASNQLGVQYTPNASGAPTNAIDLTKGGALNPVAVTGLANATTGTGAVALAQMPLRYSTAGAPTTANAAVPSNDVTLVGSNAGAPVSLHNLAAGALTAGSTDAVNGGQLYTTNQNIAALNNGTAGLVQQNQTTRAIAVGSGTDGTSVGFANNAGTARALTGVAAGTVGAGSTDATNGGQLYGTATSVATALGGGSAVNPDGTISAPTYDVANGTYTDVGSALTALNNGIASGKLSGFASNNAAGAAAPSATGDNSTAGGFGAAAAGAQSTALGNGAIDNGVANSTVVGNGASIKSGLTGSNVALGQGTTALRGAQTDYAAYGLAAPQTSAGEVAIGSATGARQLTGVAAGSQATDAVNVAQLEGATSALGTSVADGLGGGSSFNAATGQISAPSYALDNGTVTATNVGDALTNLDGRTTSNTNAISGLQNGTSGIVQQNQTTRAISVGAGTDGTSVGFANNAGTARTLTGVAAGQVAAGGTQAVNGGQLYGTARSVASALGGGSTVNPDGTLSAPSYGVNGQSYGNVGGAITALDSSGVKYDMVPGTNTRAQSITLAGGDPNQPVVIHNVGTGTARTDGANLGQVQDAEARANQYTNQQVSGVQGQLAGVNDRLSGLEANVAETRQEARSAAAIGLAAASLRFDDHPGKFSIAAGGGYWRGEAAGAFGMGYTLPDGRFRLNATAATTGSNVGVGAGASYTLN